MKIKNSSATSGIKPGFLKPVKKERPKKDPEIPIQFRKPVVEKKLLVGDSVLDPTTNTEFKVLAHVVAQMSFTGTISLILYAVQKPHQPKEF